MLLFLVICRVVTTCIIWKQIEVSLMLFLWNLFFLLSDVFVFVVKIAT